MLDDDNEIPPVDTSPPRQTMAERYGEPTAARRSTVVVVAALAAASLGWLLWAAWVHATPDVRAELNSYDVVSPHEVTVVIDVRRRGPDAVECLVQALAEDHSAVGEQLVHIPAGEAGDVRFEAAVRTNREATTALVTDCH